MNCQHLAKRYTCCIHIMVFRLILQIVSWFVLKIQLTVLTIATSPERVIQRLPSAKQFWRHCLCKSEFRILLMYRLRQSPVLCTCKQLVWVRVFKRIAYFWLLDEVCRDTLVTVCYNRLLWLSLVVDFVSSSRRILRQYPSRGDDNLVLHLLHVHHPLNILHLSLRRCEPH